MRYVACMLILVACRGPVGSPGQVGPIGQPGQNAPPVTITTSQATTAECPTGGVEVTLQEGTSANSFPICYGAIGETGAQGVPGQNATPVTEVQFCPGVTTYPNEFNEVGLCISGNIYAVYSSNGGFLVEIPPGEYSSDGINASCDFTVGLNCEVTN